MLQRGRERRIEREEDRRERRDVLVMRAIKLKS